MSEELLSPKNEDNPIPLAPNIAAETTDNLDSSSDNGLEKEAPILLELGTNTSAPPPSYDMPTYAEDIHLNSIAYIPHHHSSSFSAEHLYNNPYTTHSHHLPLPTASSSLLTSIAYPVATQLSQTIYSWNSTGRSVTELTTPSKTPPAESVPVPPPMYISYVGAREHLIAKESNPTWKEKALQIEKDYKKTACDRERTRMRDMNKAFDLLRSKLPISKPNGKKYSKIESLRIAINYINHLQECLKESSQDVESMQSNAHNSEDQSNSVSFIDMRRKIHPFQYDVRRELDGDKDESQSGAWSDNSYVPNGQDQWDS